MRPRKGKNRSVRYLGRRTCQKHLPRGQKEQREGLELLKLRSLGKRPHRIEASDLQRRNDLVLVLVSLRGCTEAASVSVEKPANHHQLQFILGSTTIVEAKTHCWGNDADGIGSSSRKEHVPSCSSSLVVPIVTESKQE